jgi:hypothetical protein
MILIKKLCRTLDLTDVFKMNKGLEKRKKIFLRYADSFNLYIKAQGGEAIYGEIGGKIYRIDKAIYVCPLCLRKFTIKAVEGENPLLTLEHVPPKALGGPSKILTCKVCNNTSGKDLDSAIMAGLKAYSFFTGKPHSSIPSRFIINSKRFEGELRYRGKNEITLRLNENYNSREVINLPPYFEQSEGRVNFILSFPSNKRFRNAVLRVAYLQAFTLFGYSFVFNDNIEKIRNHLKDNTSSLNVNMLSQGFSNDLVGIHLIREPKEVSNYLIVLPYQDADSRYNVGIILPGPGQEKWNNYLSYPEFIKNNFAGNDGNMNITLTTLMGYKGVREEKEAVLHFYTLWE